LNGQSQDREGVGAMKKKKKEKRNSLFTGAIGKIEGYSVYDYKTKKSYRVSEKEFFRVMNPENKPIVILW
jgi:hypothetical protein